MCSPIYMKVIDSACNCVYMTKTCVCNSCGPLVSCLSCSWCVVTIHGKTFAVRLKICKITKVFFLERFAVISICVQC